MGLKESRIQRAFIIHQNNFGNRPYNLEVLVEIVVRLQMKDKNKLQKQLQRSSFSSKSLLKSKKKKLKNDVMIAFSHERKIGKNVESVASLLSLYTSNHPKYVCF